MALLRNMYFDQANAFPSPSFASLDAMLQKVAPQSEVPLLRQRHLRMASMICCCDGSIILQPSSGTMQGDGIACREFTETFNPEIEEWSNKITEECDGGKIKMTNYKGEDIEMSKIVFADEINQKLHVGKETNQVIGIINRSVNYMQKQLEPLNIAQNVDKMEVQYICGGLGAHSIRRKF